MTSEAVWARFEDLARAALSAPFSGWDFSFLRGRWSEIELPWDYKARINESIRSANTMLDIGTGGGEFMASLTPLPEQTYATEVYEPNIPIARERLQPLNVEVRQYKQREALPFADAMFDLVINRHTSFDAAEVSRILKPGGQLITQQVGGANNLRLNELLTGDQKGWYWSLDLLTDQLRNAGMIIVDGQEHFPEQRFYDIGAIVYYMRAIPWQLRGYAFERYRDRLFAIHEMIERDGHLTVTSHRFLIEARKPAELTTVTR